MELNTKMSKPLVISLLVLAVVLLLVIGAAIGSHASRNRSFGYSNWTCGGVNDFERGGRNGMMSGRRIINVQGGRGMMNYRNTDQGGQIQEIIGASTESQPATVIPVTATTTVK